MNVFYKVLNKNDLSDYKSIRLELLKENPTNFGSSFEEESLFEDEMWERRLNNKNATSIGAYIGNEIIGICMVMKNPRLKMKHRAELNSMYVKKEYRGQGVSVGLLNNVFELLKDTDVEILRLSVAAHNTSAISLYKKLGFVGNDIESKALKYENEYFDLVLMNKFL